MPSWARRRIRQSAAGQRRETSEGAPACGRMVCGECSDCVEAGVGRGVPRRWALRPLRTGWLKPLPWLHSRNTVRFSGPGAADDDWQPCDDPSLARHWQSDVAAPAWVLRPGENPPSAQAMLYIEKKISTGLISRRLFERWGNLYTPTDPARRQRWRTTPCHARHGPEEGSPPHDEKI